jgi:hypothetical protein
LGDGCEIDFRVNEVSALKFNPYGGDGSGDGWCVGPLVAIDRLRKSMCVKLTEWQNGCMLQYQPGTGEHPRLKNYKDWTEGTLCGMFSLQGDGFVDGLETVRRFDRKPFVL